MSDETENYKSQIARDNILLEATLKHWWIKRRFILRIMASAILIFVAILFVLPKMYRAEASILIMPPRFVPEIRTQPLSIITVQNLLETPELYQQVILQLRRYRHIVSRLVGNAKPTAEGIDKLTNATATELMADSRITQEDADAIASLDNTEIAGLLEFDNDELADFNIEKMAKTLSSEETIEKKTATDLNYSPVLKLYAVSNSGNKAQILVNTWAKLFEEKYEHLTQGQTQRLSASLENQQEAGQEELEGIQKVLVEFKLGNNLELIQRQISDYSESFSNYHKQMDKYNNELLEEQAKANSLNNLMDVLQDDSYQWIGSVLLDNNTTDLQSLQFLDIGQDISVTTAVPVVRARSAEALRSRNDLIGALEKAAEFNRNNSLELMTSEKARLEKEFLQEKTDYRSNLVQADVAKSSLLQLESTIEGTSQSLSLLTALPDEIIGEIITSDRLKDIGKATSVNLNRQQINPLWEKLVAQQADVSRSFHEAEATIKELGEGLPAKQQDVKSLGERIFIITQAQKLVNDNLEKQEKLNKDLYNNYATMREDVFNTGLRISVINSQITALKKAVTECKTQISTLRNSYETANAKMEILELRKKAILHRADLLTQKLQESLIAVREEVSDVSMAAKAVPPARHFFPPRIILLAVMTFLTAAILLAGMSRRRYQELMAAA